VTERQVFAWLTGQTDNVGDSVLRRGYVESLETLGRVTAWAGDPRQGYVTGLGLAPSAMSRSFGTWIRTFARAAARQDTIFAFNAGEFVVTKAYFFGILLILPLLVMLKARGGSIIWLGAAVRSRKRGFTFPFRALARHSNMLRWRDTASSDVIGVRAETMPDWGFALSTDPATEASRPYLIVTLRFDRERPSDEWLDAVELAAARLNLRLLTLAQVSRDAPLARQLAARWSCDVVDWISDSHTVQEGRVRDAYRNAAIVLSDRLHALIIGFTEGALPLAWTQVRSSKIEEHFAAVGMDDITRGGSESLEALASLSSELVRQRRAVMEVSRTRILEDFDRVARDLRLATRRTGSSESAPRGQGARGASPINQPSAR
jgi:hypothetical protein